VERDVPFPGPHYNYLSEFPVISMLWALLPISFRIPRKEPPSIDLPQREMLPFRIPSTVLKFLVNGLDPAWLPLAEPPGTGVPLDWSPL